MVDGIPVHAKTVEIAQALVELLGPLDVDTRHRAIQGAMLLMGDQAPTLGPSRGNGANSRPQDLSTSSASLDIGTFFNREEEMRPADNAYLCSAYHYGLYGTVAFSLNDLRSIASEAGVVLPDRLDMTLKQAGTKGKKLFLTAGKDAYRPTATAGLYFKERFGVTPGRRSKSNQDEGAA